MWSPTQRPRFAAGYKPLRSNKAWLVASSIATLLLLSWTSPVVRSAVWGLKVPFRQPGLDIPHDTAGVRTALVIPKTRQDDIRWTRTLDPEKFASFVYSMDAWPESQYLQPRSLRGREAAGYLSYILDHYDALPQFSLFIHAGRYQWHNDLFLANKPDDQLLTLQNLRLAAIDAKGYVNMRCKHHPGCPVALNLRGPNKEKSQSWVPNADFVQVYTELFNVSRDDAPDHLASACCAQFAVSRQRVLERPKEDYEHMLRWTQETDLLNDYAIGWMFEKIWHVLFRDEAISCPRVEQCRCDNFGWCGPLESGEVLRPAGISG